MTSKFENWLATKYPEMYKDLHKEMELDELPKNKIPFSDWWDLYAKKVGMHKSKTCWNRLTAAEQTKAMMHTPGYVKSNPDKQFRANPLTYLNGKYFNDEEIRKSSTKDNGVQQRVSENLEQWRSLLD